MKIGRKSNSLPRANAELINLCDYAMDDDVHVQLTMEEVDRLDIVVWEWDAQTQTPWVLVENIRSAVACDELKKRL